MKRFLMNLTYFFSGIIFTLVTKNVIFSYEIIFWIFSSVFIIFYTIFAPNIFFYDLRKKDGYDLFNRWKRHNIFWNIHQSLIHFIGSLIGFISIYILFFKLNVLNVNQYEIKHLIFLIVGLLGIMGFIPRILFEYKLDLEETAKKSK